MRPWNHQVAIFQPHMHIIDPAYARSALDDGIKHRLHIRRRAADDAEHFGRSRLILYSFGKLAIATLELLGDALHLFFESVQFGRARTFFLFYDVNASHLRSPGKAFSTEMPTKKIRNRNIESRNKQSNERKTRKKIQNPSNPNRLCFGFRASNFMLRLHSVRLGVSAVRL